MSVIINPQTGQPIHNPNIQQSIKAALGHIQRLYNDSTQHSIDMTIITKILELLCKQAGIDMVAEIEKIVNEMNKPAEQPVEESEEE